MQSISISNSISLIVIIVISATGGEPGLCVKKVKFGHSSFIWNTKDTNNTVQNTKYFCNSAVFALSLSADAKSPRQNEQRGDARLSVCVCPMCCFG